MLPGEAPPGRGAPGLAAPGRGAWGRGMGRSTGCDENGLLPTRGRPAGLGMGPGRGPGVVPGWGAGWPGGWAGADGAGAAGGAGASATAAAGAGGTGAGTARGAPGLAGALVASPLPTALSRALSRVASMALPDDFPGPVGATLAGAGLLPPNDSRSRRATGASTVDDADLTNSPCSFSRASTSLLLTPSSLANSCTRALPATTSPV